MKLMLLDHLSQMHQAWKARAELHVQTMNSVLPAGWKVWALDSPNETMIHSDMLGAGILTPIAQAYGGGAMLADFVKEHDQKLGLSFKLHHGMLLQESKSASTSAISS